MKDTKEQNVREMEFIIYKKLGGETACFCDICLEVMKRAKVFAKDLIHLVKGK